MTRTLKVLHRDISGPFTDSVLNTIYLQYIQYVNATDMTTAYDNFSDKKVVYVDNDVVPKFKSVTTFPAVIANDTDFLEKYDAMNKSEAIPIYIKKGTDTHWAIYKKWW